MNILLSALGTAGDVHPFLALGAALKRRGHGVTLITHAYFEALARKTGLEFKALRTADDYSRRLDDPDLWHPRRGLAVVAKEFLLEMRPIYQIISRAYVPKQTVVVASPLIFCAQMAHEKLGAPVVTIVPNPALFRSLFDSPILPVFNAPAWAPKSVKSGFYRVFDFFADKILLPENNKLRAELGLAPINRVLERLWNFPERIIGLFPAWFAAPQTDWPSQARLTGFLLHDAAEIKGMPADLDSFLNGGEPPIVFTAGSAMRHGAWFYKESIEACGLLGRRGILLTPFAEQIPASLPFGIRHFPYAPFSRLLPRAAALVHHGGIGTTAQALASGVPQLVMPMAYDQFDNAFRTARLGAGLHIKRRAYSAAAAAHLLDRLLRDRTIHERCRAVAARFTGSDPASDACRLIEGAASAC